MEVADWMSYYQLEPFGYKVDWLRTGVVAAMIANVNRKKGTKPAMPEDFIPKRKVLKKKRQTVEEQRGVFKQIMAWAKAAGKVKDG